MLDKIFRKYNEFLPDYHKDISTFVRICYLQKIPEDLQGEIRRKEDKLPTLIIYKTGSVTQSGPHPILNKIVFEKFLQVIGNHMEAIRR